MQKRVENVSNNSFVKIAHFVAIKTAKCFIFIHQNLNTFLGLKMGEENREFVNCHAK